MIRPAPATAGGGRGWTAGVIGAWMLGCGFVACSIAGCGPAVATIEGTVRYDGRPVDAGRISFVPLAAGHKAAWGEVREGAYSVAGEPGSYRVEISWPRLTGRTVRGGFSGTDLLPETEEAIPAAYNADRRASAPTREKRRFRGDGAAGPGTAFRAGAAPGKRKQPAYESLIRRAMLAEVPLAGLSSGPRRRVRRRKP